MGMLVKQFLSDSTPVGEWEIVVSTDAQIYRYDSNIVISDIHSTNMISVSLGYLLQVVGVLDPGFTRWRGMVLQSFVVAWLDLAKEEAERGSISKTEFKARNVTIPRALWFIIPNILVAQRYFFLILI